jgi:hypothetical protein
MTAGNRDADARAARLRQALRDNLRKRKAQQRPDTGGEIVGDSAGAGQEDANGTDEQRG